MMWFLRCIIFSYVSWNASCKNPDLEESSVSSVDSTVIKKERRDRPLLAVNEVHNTSACEESFYEVILFPSSTSSMSSQSDSQTKKKSLPKGCTEADNNKLDEHKKNEKKQNTSTMLLTAKTFLFRIILTSDMLLWKCALSLFSIGFMELEQSFDSG